MDLAAVVQNTFQEARDLAASNAEDTALHATLVAVAEASARALESGGRIITMGNGGSMCDASHCAEELTGRYRKDRRPLAAMALNDAGHMSCVANDFGYDKIFSRGVTAHAREGDVVIGFSTSGNSPNILEALKCAKEAGAVAVGFLGKGGGKAKELCDHSLIVGGATPDRIQEQHIQIVHTLIELIERQMFPDHYA